MKNRIIFFIISSLIVFGLNSCEEKKEGSLTVRNKLKKAVISRLEWGEFAVSSYLLPGENSRTLTFVEDDYYYGDLPQTHILSFYVEANGGIVYLQTKNSFTLNYGDELLIDIDSATEIINPLIEMKSYDK